MKYITLRRFSQKHTEVKHFGFLVILKLYVILYTLLRLYNKNIKSTNFIIILFLLKLFHFFQ